MAVRITPALLEGLFKANKGAQHGPRDQAAIAAAALWGLMASELSQVTIKDVMNTDGSLKARWTLPAHIAFNGRPRDLFTVHETLIDKLSAYVSWRSKRNIGTTNLKRFASLNPNSELFLDDQGAPFGFTERSAKTGTKRVVSQQATGILRYYRDLVRRDRIAARKGLTFRDFRRCFIQELAKARLTTRNIMAVTGIRDYATVSRIAKSDPITVEAAIGGIYTRL
jgi:integrase